MVYLKLNLPNTFDNGEFIFIIVNAALLLPRSLHRRTFFYERLKSSLPFKGANNGLPGWRILHR
jgi:hypothetical protein